MSTPTAAAPTAAAPTVAEFLADVTARLDALCGAPLTENEDQLWRALANLTAAVRALAAAQLELTDDEAGD